MTLRCNDTCRSQVAMIGYFGQRIDQVRDNDSNRLPEKSLKFDEIDQFMF